MKLIKKHNKKLLITTVLVLVFLFLLRGKIYDAYVYYTNNGETMRDPGSGPSAEEQKQLEEYYKKCPLDKLSSDTFSSEFKDFYLGKVLCSYNENPSFKAKTLGEEADVEIYTKDFEAGKQEFRDWLKSKGLVESPTLRITYVYKPQ